MTECNMDIATAQQKLSKVIKNCIVRHCNNELTFQKMHILGLLSVTLDEDDTFVIDLKHNVSKTKTTEEIISVGESSEYGASSSNSEQVGQAHTLGNRLEASAQVTSEKQEKTAPRMLATKLQNQHGISLTVAVETEEDAEKLRRMGNWSITILPAQLGEGEIKFEKQNTQPSENSSGPRIIVKQDLKNLPFKVQTKSGQSPSKVGTEKSQDQNNNASKSHLPGRPALASTSHENQTAKTSHVQNASSESATRQTSRIEIGGGSGQRMLSSPKTSTSLKQSGKLTSLSDLVQKLSEVHALATQLTSDGEFNKASAEEASGLKERNEGVNQSGFVDIRRHEEELYTSVRPWEENCQSLDAGVSSQCPELTDLTASDCDGSVDSRLVEHMQRFVESLSLQDSDDELSAGNVGDEVRGREDNMGDCEDRDSEDNVRECEDRDSDNNLGECDDINTRAEKVKKYRDELAATVQRARKLVQVLNDSGPEGEDELAATIVRARLLLQVADLEGLDLCENPDTELPKSEAKKCESPMTGAINRLLQRASKHQTVSLNEGQGQTSENEEKQSGNTTEDEATDQNENKAQDRSTCQEKFICQALEDKENADPSRDSMEKRNKKGQWRFPKSLFPMFDHSVNKMGFRITDCSALLNGYMSEASMECPEESYSEDGDMSSESISSSENEAEEAGDMKTREEEQAETDPHPQEEDETVVSGTQLSKFKCYFCDPPHFLPTIDSYIEHQVDKAMESRMVPAKAQHAEATSHKLDSGENGNNAQATQINPSESASKQREVDDCAPNNGDDDDEETSSIGYDEVNAFLEYIENQAKLQEDGLLHVADKPAQPSENITIPPCDPRPTKVNEKAEETASQKQDQSDQPQTCSAKSKSAQSQPTEETNKVVDICEKPCSKNGTGVQTEQSDDTKEICREILKKLYPFAANKRPEISVNEGKTEATKEANDKERTKNPRTSTQRISPKKHQKQTSSKSHPKSPTNMSTMPQTRSERIIPTENPFYLIQMGQSLEKTFQKLEDVLGCTLEKGSSKPSKADDQSQINAENSQSSENVEKQVSQIEASKSLVSSTDEQQIFHAPLRKEPTPARKEPSPLRKEPTPARKEPTPARKEPSPLRKEPTPARKEPTPARKEPTPLRKEPTPARKAPTPTRKEPTPARKEPTPARKEPTPARKEPILNRKEPVATKKSPKYNPASKFGKPKKKIYHGTPGYVCYVCGEVLWDKILLLEHLNLEHIVKTELHESARVPSPCKVLRLPSTFPYKADDIYDIYSARQSESTCKFCDRSFDKVFDFTNHIIYNHISSFIRYPSELKLCYCVYCPKVFSSLEAIIMHDCHGELDDQTSMALLKLAKIRHERQMQAENGKKTETEAETEMEIEESQDVASQKTNENTSYFSQMVQKEKQDKKAEKSRGAMYEDMHENLNNCTENPVCKEGAAGFDIKEGAAGFNIKEGAAGFDIKEGAAGFDIKEGAAGFDIKEGAAGFDIKEGAAGFDIKDGGAGAMIKDLEGALYNTMSHLQTPYLCPMCGEVFKHMRSFFQHTKSHIKLGKSLPKRTVGQRHAHVRA